MNCHLVVSHPPWPAIAGVAPSGEPALPALEMILARGQRTRTEGGAIEHWLVSSFGGDRDADLALAPFALRGDGHEPGEHGWLRADPVHLQLHANRVVLSDSSRLAITADEAQRLVDALNAHFAERSILFIAPHPQRWYLRVASAPQLRTTPTAEAVGQDIEPHLPTGKEQARWRSILNEAQMLLHEHPCNKEREQRGAPAVNSLWFWGAGARWQPRARYHAVWSDDPTARGLAFASRIAVHPLSESASEFIDTAGRPPLPLDPLHLVILPPLPVAHGEAGAWHEALMRIEQNWFAPLLASTLDGVLASVTLHLLGPAAGWNTYFTRAHRAKFWRRRRRLSHYCL